MTNGSSIDELIENFDFEEIESKDGSKQGGMVGTWLPDSYKTRYDELQTKTQKSFGKLVKKIIMHAIDKVDRAS